MKKLSKKSVLLFASVMALCAFAMPSMASAASWGTINTNHVLDSPDLAFNAPLLGGGSSCANSSFNTDVRSAAVLTVTSGTFTNCSGTGGNANCAVTVTPTGFPWLGTGVSQTDLRIDRVNIDVVFNGPAPCAVPGVKISLTGTLGTGAASESAWDVLAHQVTLTNTHGLTAHVVGTATSVPTTVNGRIRDTAQTLTLT